VKSFGQLRSAEYGYRKVGVAFGNAVVALRDEVKSRRGRDFMARLKELGISQEKARYWMAKAEGKQTDRHHRDAPVGWDSAFECLKELRGKLVFLRKPSHKAEFEARALAFAQELDKLAAELRSGDDRGRRNHARVLQRKQQAGGSHIAVAHGQPAHPAGGRR
jgi:hypothetical protein